MWGVWLGQQGQRKRLSGSGLWPETSRKGQPELAERRVAEGWCLHRGNGGRKWGLQKLTRALWLEHSGWRAARGAEVRPEWWAWRAASPVPPGSLNTVDGTLRVSEDTLWCGLCWTLVLSQCLCLELSLFHICRLWRKKNCPQEPAWGLVPLLAGYDSCVRLPAVTVLQTQGLGTGKGMLPLLLTSLFWLSPWGE